jgi:hypothetical protein
MNEWNELMIGKVRSAALDNQRITIRELPDKLGLSFGSVQSILTEDLGMKHFSAKFVPNLLTVEQKEIRLAVARDLLQCADQDANFMKIIITGDEFRNNGYDPETKVQSSQWKALRSPRPKSRPSLGQSESDVCSFLRSRRLRSP